jgi:hypothetical protein
METSTNRLILINSIMGAIPQGKPYKKAIAKAAKDTGLEARTLEKYVSEFIRRAGPQWNWITGARGHHRPRKRVRVKREGRTAKQRRLDPSD